MLDGTSSHLNKRNSFTIFIIPIMQNYIHSINIRKLDYNNSKPYIPLCMTKTYFPLRCWGLKKSCSSNSTRSLKPFDAMKVSAASRVAGRSWTINFLISGYLKFRKQINKLVWSNLICIYLLDCKWAAERSLTASYINNSILSFGDSIPWEVGSNSARWRRPDCTHASKGYLKAQ